MKVHVSIKDRDHFVQRMQEQLTNANIFQFYEKD